MLLDDVADGSGGQEVLLAQTQNLALYVVVVGVQDLADQLGGGVLGDGAAVIARVEAAHIKVRGLGLPQAQLGHAVSIVALHVHIAGHGQNAVVVHVLHVVEVAVPGLLDLAVKANFHGLVGVALQPDLAAGQPVVGPLLLPAVHDLLLEDAVLVQNAVTGAGNAGGGHAVQIAGGQAAQAAVAQAGVRLFLIDGLQLDVGLGQRLLGHFVQAQAEQAGFQAAAHQKLHAQVVHLLFAVGEHLAQKLFVLVAHHLAADQGQRAVNLLVAGNLQADAVFAGELIAQQLIKFFHGIVFHVCTPNFCGRGGDPLLPLCPAGRTKQTRPALLIIGDMSRGFKENLAAYRCFRAVKPGKLRKYGAGKARLKQRSRGVFERAANFFAAQAFPAVVFIL